MSLRLNPIFILLLFCIPLFFLNIQPTHNYGDDWAQYLKEAINMAEGKPFHHSAYIFNPLNTDYAPPQYPPGYPLLLVPLVKCTGSAILPLLYLNSFFLCVMLFAGYAYFGQKTSRTKALCLTLVLTYLFAVIDLKGQILSDIPCALFLLLYLAIRERKTEWDYGRLLLLSVIGAFAMLIRVQAVVVVFAELLFFILSLRKGSNSKTSGKFLWLPPSLFLALTVIFFFAVANYILFPTPESGLGFYINLYRVAFDDSVWRMIFMNARYLAQLLNDILYHQMNDPIFQVFVSVMTTSSLILVLIGFIKALQERVSFSLLFFIFMCVLILVTPVHQGLRYFLPAIPVFLLLMVKGAGVLMPRRLRVRIKTDRVAIAFLVIFLLLGYDDYERKLYPTYEWTVNHTDSIAFDYIKKHVGNNDIILFSKPRLLVLYTDKKSMNFSWQQPVGVNKEQFDSLGINYLLYCRHLGLELIDSFLRLRPQPYSDSTIINSEYVLYQLKRDPDAP